MQNHRKPFLAFAVSLSTLSLATPAFAQFNITADCTRGESLANAAAFAFPNTILNIKGTCSGPVNINTNGLQLVARGATSINGGGKNAITISGAQRITLTGLTITGGANGIVAQNGAQITLKNDTVTANVLTGIVAQANSSVTLNGGSNTANGLHGIDVESTSALVVTGSYAISGNGVFGINVNNGSSLTLNAANLTVSNNTLGVQLGTNSSGFVDGQSQFNTSRNFTVGLTMVSRSHMVDFGGTITSDGNFFHGISLNSKSGLDLDAASQVHASGNSVDGVHLEQLSVMTIFNNPQFSQAPDATRLTVEGNGGDGINLLSGSEILVDNFASIASTINRQIGIALDDGSSITFGQTIPVTGVATGVGANPIDLQLGFGSRLTYLANDVLGIVKCDSTVLVRGPGNIKCPM